MLLALTEPNSTADISMSLKKLPAFFSLLTAMSLVLAACSNNDGSGSGDDDSGSAEDNVRQIAGNSAVGAPGSWSDNCLNDGCSRADADGNYRLQVTATSSDLMHSDIPLNDGTELRLYSFYRHNDDLTSALVNMNPTTHALLDARSVYTQGQSISLCALSTSCRSAIVNDFSETVQQTMVSQLDGFLGNAYPAGRDPFTDIYVADSSDALDVMHDYLNFVIGEDIDNPDDNAPYFFVYDNDEDSEPLLQIPLGELMTYAVIEETDTLTDDQFDAAREIDPPGVAESQINLVITYSPNTGVETPPTTANVSLAGSYTPEPPLTYVHDVTLANGTSLQFTGETVETVIEDSGTHIWVVTATDTAGNVEIDGVEIRLLADDQDPDPQFGGDGSCYTPSPLNANLMNICEETQDGSIYGVCDEVISQSVTVVFAAAPCAREEQNGGALIGVCTLIDVQRRIFQYVNPERPSNESFSEEQARVADQCINSLLGDWSETPQ